MNILAGLYKTEDQTIKAYQALLSAGFNEKDLSVLVRKSVEPEEFPKRASAKDVAISASAGALIFGILGLLLVLMVGLGVIELPMLLSNVESGIERVSLSLGILVVFLFALTGTLIGAAIRLIRSTDRVKITSRGISPGGLLLTVNIDPSQQATAKKVLVENGAVDVENLTEMWDPEVWSRYKVTEIP